MVGLEVMLVDLDNITNYLQKIYGYETTAQDVYYLYIWFSTGYLGAALIFGQMIYIAYLIS